MKLTVFVILLLFAALQLWFRLWPVPSEVPVIKDVDRVISPDGVGRSLGFEGGWMVEVDDPSGTSLQAVCDALASEPRTRVLRTTDDACVFVTRSWLWGFPDITEARQSNGTLRVKGHLVIGRSDLGVNKARIKKVLAQAGFTDL